MGPRRDHFLPGLRVHFYRSYAMYYTFNDSELIIVRVLHGARDARALFNEKHPE